MCKCVHAHSGADIGVDHDKVEIIPQNELKSEGPINGEVPTSRR